MFVIAVSPLARAIWKRPGPRGGAGGPAARAPRADGHRLRPAPRLGAGGIKLVTETRGLSSRRISGMASLCYLAAEAGQLRGLLPERGKLPDPDDREHHYLAPVIIRTIRAASMKNVKPRAGI